MLNILAISLFPDTWFQSYALSARDTPFESFNRFPDRSGQNSDLDIQSPESNTEISR